MSYKSFKTEKQGEQMKFLLALTITILSANSFASMLLPAAICTGVSPTGEEYRVSYQVDSNNYCEGNEYNNNVVIVIENLKGTGDVLDDVASAITAVTDSSNPSKIAASSVETDGLKVSLEINRDLESKGVIKIGNEESLKLSCNLFHFQQDCDK